MVQSLQVNLNQNILPVGRVCLLNSKKYFPLLITTNHRLIQPWTDPTKDQSNQRLIQPGINPTKDQFNQGHIQPRTNSTKDWFNQGPFQPRIDPTEDLSNQESIIPRNFPTKYRRIQSRTKDWSNHWLSNLSNYGQLNYNSILLHLQTNLASFKFFLLIRW